MKKIKKLILSVLLISIIGTVFAGCGKTAANKKSLDEYAAIAMKQAVEAATWGTFGVGGLLMDLDGNVICAMHNCVIDGNRTNDPTAHGERQIVDWYLANKEKEHLPEPENCILITSLDPCVMCTGALALVKFKKVIVIEVDDYSGINWECNDECHALDGLDCQEYVKEHFVYPEVTGESARNAFGATLDDINLFSDITISSKTLKICHDAFYLTADGVRQKVASTKVALSDIKNPAELEATHPIRKYLSESLGSDFLACIWEPGSSGEEFISYIQKEHPGFNGVAYFDVFGNLIYLDEDDPDIPTQSAFMKVTRKLAAVRNTDPIEGYEINEYFINPKCGYFVYMTCPTISDKTLMELGGIGSTFESASLHPILYIYGNENEEAINAVAGQLPPLYKDINIRFKQIQFVQ